MYILCKRGHCFLLPFVKSKLLQHSLLVDVSLVVHFTYLCSYVVYSVLFFNRLTVLEQQSQKNDGHILCKILYFICVNI